MKKNRGVQMSEAGHKFLAKLGKNAYVQVENVLQIG